MKKGKRLQEQKIDWKSRVKQQIEECPDLVEHGSAITWFEEGTPANDGDDMIVTEALNMLVYHINALHHTMLGIKNRGDYHK